MAIDQKALKTMLTLMSEDNKKAFNQFYDATIGLTFASILRITSNKQLAEEVASDVYMQAWQTAASYDSNLSAPTTWLLMIARSRSLDALRREKSATRNQLPMIENYDAPDEEITSPLTETMEVQSKVALKGLLKVLSDSERQMITLAFYKDMSHIEIAKYTGKPLGSVKTTLRRAQGALRSALKMATPLRAEAAGIL